MAPGATRRFLESWAGPVKGDAATASNHPYASQADFILKHGRAFEWRAVPRGVRMGTARQCFRNFLRLALRRPQFYTYADRYAVNTWVARYPVAHGLCVDPKRSVLDTTWDEGTDYFGMPFRVEHARRTGDARKDDNRIANKEIGFPLLTRARAIADGPNAGESRADYRGGQSAHWAKTRKSKRDGRWCRNSGGRQAGNLNISALNGKWR